MSDGQPLSNTIIQILKIKDDILLLDIDTFTRKRELGEINYFKELVNDFIELQNYLRKFSSIALSQIPEVSLAVILQQLKAVETSIQQIKNFSLTPTQATGAALPVNYIQTLKVSAVTSFRNNFRNFFNTTNSLIAFGITSSSNIDEFISKKDELEQVVADSKRLHETQKNLTKNVQSTATSSKLSGDKSEFDSQVRNHNIASWCWLVFAAAIFIVIIIYISCGFDSEHLKDIYTSLTKVLSDAGSKSLYSAANNLFFIQVIKLFLIRVLIISFLSFLLVFSLKQYNSQKHNATIKQHKANCITAYQFLEKSISTPTAKDEVLSLVLKAVFEQQETGYRGDDSKVSNPNLIANIIESKIPISK